MARPKEQGNSRSLDPLNGGLVHNPFAALRPSDQARPPKEASRDLAEPGSPSPEAAEEGNLLGGRIVVSLERKGHGGKSVVRIQGLNGDGAALKSLARDLGRALGRGARQEGHDLLVQGSELDGPMDWLKAQGAQAVIRGTQ